MTIIKTFTIAIAVTSAAVITSCTARADPPPFPDLNSYTPVNVKDYAIDTTSPGHPSSQVFFLTPDGIPCGFSSGTAGCTGDNLPGVPAEDKNPYTYIDTSTVAQPARSTSYVNNTIHDQPIKTLPPLHSISVNGVICGVDGSGMTACKDPEGRGFILSPSWSGWLPHV